MKRKSLIIFVTLFLFAAGGLGAYFIFTSPEQKKGTETTQITGPVSQPKKVSTQGEEITGQAGQSPTTEPVDTSDWKTYKNEEYGYKLLFPANFTIQESGYGVKFIPPEYFIQYERIPVEKWPVFLFIHAEKVEAQLSLEDWILKAHYWGKDIHTFQEVKDLFCVKQFTIGRNIQAYGIFWPGQAFGTCFFFCKRGDTGIVISAIQPTFDCNSCSIHWDPVFYKMISTFEFFKKDKKK